MTQHMQYVTVRNARGRQLLDALRVQAAGPLDSDSDSGSVSDSDSVSDSGSGSESDSGSGSGSGRRLRGGFAGPALERAPPESSGQRAPFVWEVGRPFLPAAFLGIRV